MSLGLSYQKIPFFFLLTIDVFFPLLLAQRYNLYCIAVSFLQFAFEEMKELDVQTTQDADVQQG